MASDPSEPDADPQPRLDRITVYPVKSLDPTPVDAARILADGDYVNGKRERAVHRLRSAYDSETTALRLDAPDWDDPDPRTYVLDDESDRAAATADLTDYFGYEVRLRRDETGGFPDDTAAAGPTLVSAATVREVASWFDGIDPAGVRRRLRPNLVASGVPPFWEDRLFANRGQVVAFDVIPSGDGTNDDDPAGGSADRNPVRLAGVNPCQRCVVPSRDPETGTETPGFRETFVQRREATMPEWSGGDWFDHHYRLMVNTRVPVESVGERIAVGDRLRIRGVRED